LKKTKINRVGIVTNSGKPTSRTVVRRAAALISRTGRKVLSDEATAQLAGLRVETCPGVAALTRQVDLLVVFGGDGTMLRVAREMNGSRTPVLGINIGGLGFLTAVPSDDLSVALQHVWKGEYHLESRALIQATARRRDKTIEATALNDVVISRGIVSRLIELEVSVNHEVLTRYRCDGLIVSSPTGSTAYSLAAGGAIVNPTAEVFTITPICPHTLSNRSVIVNLDSVIGVTVINPKPETIFSADGQGESALQAGDSVTICRSRHSVQFIRLPGSSFFQTLRHKLHWSGSSIPVRTDLPVPTAAGAASRFRSVKND
jgi:NAD+ kinase